MHSITDSKIDVATACRLLLLAFACTLISTFANPAKADPDQLRLVTKPSFGPTGGEHELSGLWPDSCLPALQSVQREQRYLHLYLESAEKSSCSTLEQPFQLLVPELDYAETDLVMIHHRYADEEPAQLIALINIPQNRGPQKALHPESGWWWYEQGGNYPNGGPGSGLTLEFNGRQATIIVHTFNTEGDPEWLLATADLSNDGRLNAPLLKLLAGQEILGPYRAPQVENTDESIYLRLHSATTGTAWFIRRQGQNLNDPIEVRAVSLVRYQAKTPVYQHMLNGRWIVVNTESGSEMPSSIIEITAVERKNAQTIALLDSSGIRIGECQASFDQPDTPPQRCQIQWQDLDIKIENIGLQRMYGTEVNHGEIAVFRLPD